MTRTHGERSDRVRVRFKLEGPDVHLHALGWPTFRDFMEQIVRALCAMPCAPVPSEVVPVALREGSAEVLLDIPRRSIPAVETLRRGPRKTWNRQMRQAAEPLYEFVRERRAVLSCGTRKPRPVVVPEQERHFELRELGVLRGTVHQVGGHEAKIGLRSEDEGLVRCEADVELAKRIAFHLYEDVDLEAEIRRDPHTGAILKVTAVGFTPVRRRPFPEAYRDLLEFLGDSTAGLDVEGHIRELRG